MAPLASEVSSLMGCHLQQFGWGDRSSNQNSKLVPVLLSSQAGGLTARRRINGTTASSAINATFPQPFQELGGPPSFPKIVAQEAFLSGDKVEDDVVETAAPTNGRIPEWPPEGWLSGNRPAAVSSNRALVKMRTFRSPAGFKKSTADGGHPR